MLLQGGVIAYPTEYCFGLGCDPSNQNAVQRILDIKRRSVDQGLIMIAANLVQVNAYADVQASPLSEEILASWPGPFTWTLPTLENVPNWVKGKHDSIAMRVTAHKLSSQLCHKYGGAIISTSANRHAQPALLSAATVAHVMGEEVDYIIDASVGGAKQASQIKDGISGAILR